MKKQKHLFLPLATGTYIAALILISTYEFNDSLWFVITLTLGYLAAALIYETRVGKLGFEKVAEIGTIVLLSQYLILFM